jgi:hypothetical protein
MSEWQEIVQQRPPNIDEAIPCLRKALERRQVLQPVLPHRPGTQVLLRKRRFGRIEIEGLGGMSAVQGKTMARLKEAVQPF